MQMLALTACALLKSIACLNANDTLVGATVLTDVCVECRGDVALTCQGSESRRECLLCSRAHETYQEGQGLIWLVLHRHVQHILHLFL